jgi:hypothetical protein
MRVDLRQSHYIVLLVGITILSSLFLTSCASHLKYPSEWSALVSIEDNKCPDISGRYVIAGETIEEPHLYESEEAFTDWTANPVEKADNKIRTLYLYEVFPIKYFISRGAITGAAYVQISQPDDDTLEISFMNDQGLIDKKIYSITKKEYVCSPLGISFPFSQGHTMAGMATGMAGPIPFAMGMGNWGKYYMNKSIDGCLILKEEGTVMVFFVMIPMWRSYETWHRFKQKSLP